MTYQEDPSFHEAIVKLREYVEKYRDTGDVIVSFSIGYVDADNFSSNIGREFYENIIEEINDSDTWTSIDVEEVNEYTKDNVCLRVYDDGSSECNKTEVLNEIYYRYDGTGFDVRVVFSREIPSTRISRNNVDSIVSVSSTIYLHEYLTYKFSKKTFEENTLQRESYEIEIKTSMFYSSSHYIVHDCLLKLKDLIYMCEEIDEDNSLTLVVEK